MTVVIPARGRPLKYASLQESTVPEAVAPEPTPVMPPTMGPMSLDVLSRVVESLSRIIVTDGARLDALEVKVQSLTREVARLEAQDEVAV